MNDKELMEKYEEFKSKSGMKVSFENFKESYIGFSENQEKIEEVTNKLLCLIRDIEGPVRNEKFRVDVTLPAVFNFYLEVYKSSCPKVMLATILEANHKMAKSALAKELDS